MRGPRWRRGAASTRAIPSRRPRRSPRPWPRSCRRSAGSSSRWRTRSPPWARCWAPRWRGRKAMTASSGPGFSLMQEHIGYAAYAEIPCVIVDVMRVGPSTGLPTSPAQGDVMQARWGTHGDHPVIALAPASVAEVYELTVRAFTLSERYRTPVILLYDEVIGHVRERVALPRAGRAAPRRASPPATAPRPSTGRIAPDRTACRRWRTSARAIASTSPGWPTTSAGTPRRTRGSWRGCRSACTPSSSGDATTSCPTRASRSTTRTRSSWPWA